MKNFWRFAKEAGADAGQECAMIRQRPDGITIQLQDDRYCGGSSALGTVCDSTGGRDSVVRSLIHLTGSSASASSTSNVAVANGLATSPSFTSRAVTVPGWKMSLM